jgi:hypothetical protein
MTILGEPQELNGQLKKPCGLQQFQFLHRPHFGSANKSNSGTITKCLDLNELINVPQLQFVKFSDTLRRSDECLGTK